ncbi:MAG: cupin domain-containing protein [Burkholderiales bacterium]
MKASMKPIRNEFSWGTIEWLANDEVGNSRELSLARMTLLPGRATDTHLHANCEESIYVVRGEVECRIGDDRVRIRAGGQSVVPRGAVHGIHNAGDVPTEIILSYSSAARAFELA